MKSNIRGNTHQDGRFKINPKRQNFEDSSSKSKNKPNNYYAESNNNDGFDNYYQNKPQKKGRIIKKKNYNCETYDSNYDNNYKHHGNNSKFNQETNQAGESEIKSSQNKASNDNDANKMKKAIFNKFDAFANRAELKTDFNARLNNGNIIRPNYNQNRFDQQTGLENKSTPIDISSMLSSLNINAQAYVPKTRRMQQFEY